MFFGTKLWCLLHANICPSTGNAMSTSCSFFDADLHNLGEHQKAEIIELFPDRCSAIETH